MGLWPLQWSYWGSIYTQNYWRPSHQLSQRVFLKEVARGKQIQKMKGEIKFWWHHLKASRERYLLKPVLLPYFPIIWVNIYLPCLNQFDLGSCHLQLKEALLIHVVCQITSLTSLLYQSLASSTCQRRSTYHLLQNHLKCLENINS